MVRIRELFTLCLFIYATSAAAENYIYFHWGSYPSNRELLELSNYEFTNQPHDRELSTSRPGVLNAAALMKAYDWFFKGTQSDASGPGIYVSMLTHDSANFGPDLMIAEVVEPPKDFLPKYEFNGPSEYNYKTHYQNGLITTSPYIVKYTDSWHVIPRLPKVNEPMIRLRPPNAGDVERWRIQTLKIAEDKAKQISDGTAFGLMPPMPGLPGSPGVPGGSPFPGQPAIPGIPEKETVTKEEVFLIELNNVATVADLERPGFPNSRTSRSAEIFLDRIVYDVGYQYFVQTAVPFMKSLREQPDQGKKAGPLLIAMRALAETFTKKIPNDERTRYLRDVVAYQYQTMDSDMFLILQSRSGIQKAIEFMSTSSMASRQAFLNNLISNFSTKSAHVLSLLMDVKKYSSYSPSEIAIVERFIEDKVIKLAPAQLEFMTNLQDMFSLLSRSTAGRQWLTAYLKNNLYGPLVLNSIHTSMRLTPAIIDTNFTPLVGRLFGPELNDVLLPLVQDMVNLNVKIPSYRGDLLVSFLLKVGDFGPKTSIELNKLARERLSTFSSKALLTSFGTFSIFENSQIFDEDIRRVKFIMQNLPQLIPNLIVSIQNSILSQLEPLHHMKRMTLLNELIEKEGNKQNAILSETLRMRVRHHHQSSVHFSTAKQGFNAAQFVNVDLSKSLYPISGSSEYSELAKVFSLVDPVFVTEDLLINNARTPKLRFNESYFIEGKAYSQPAWENFREAWSHLSLQTIRSHYERKDVGFPTFPVAVTPGTPIIPTIPTIPNIPGLPSDQNRDILMDLSSIVRLLVSGNVDRSNILEDSSNWKRDKYKTVFTQLEWTRYVDSSLESELSKYFRMTIENGQRTLQFKTMEELKVTIPELKTGDDNGFIMANPQDSLFKYIEAQTKEIKDPVLKITRILFLMTKLHPAENGNGRLGRLWASVVALQSGLPVPMSLPTNDFIMSEERMEWEVRRALANGKFYAQMLKNSLDRGIEAKDFFHVVYKGSALEGLSHVDVKDLSDLKDYVRYLEAQEYAPEWGKEYLKKVQEKIVQLRSEKGSIGKISEVRRDMAMEDMFSLFKKSNSLDFRIASPRLSTRGASRTACLGFYR